VIEALTRPGANLVRETQEIGKGMLRIAVQRQEHNVGSFIKDRLGTVTMVEIHIEHRNPFGPLIKEGLGTNGNVVYETVTAVQVAGRMMAGRPAQGKGSSFPLWLIRAWAVNATFAAA